jgi:hypothetical protein
MWLQVLIGLVNRYWHSLRHGTGLPETSSGRGDGRTGGGNPANNGSNRLMIVLRRGGYNWDHGVSLSVERF